MKPSKRPHPLPSSRRHRVPARPPCGLHWLLAHEFEDDEEAIVGPGHDRIDAESAG
jgi:hypothetical protein